MDVDSAFRLYGDIRSSATSKLDIADVANMVKVICSFWVKNRRGVYMKGQKGADDWLEFEHRIWGLGEDLRIILKKNKSWRGDNVLNDVFVSVLTSKEFGKGRQTFALLLGDYGAGGGYSASLGGMLDDGQVCGHVIKSLSKLKDGGHCESVLKISKGKHAAWVRNAAKKYIKNFCEHNANNANNGNNGTRTY